MILGDTGGHCGEHGVTRLGTVELRGGPVGYCLGNCGDTVRHCEALWGKHQDRGVLPNPHWRAGPRASGLQVALR